MAYGFYGFHQSEQLLGECFGQKREKVKIISKSGVGWHANKRVNMSNEPKQTRQMLENSLRALSTDYIDIYMIHWPDSKIDIRYPLEVLVKAKEQKKIHAIGLCNTHYNDLVLAQEVAQIEYLQSEINLFNNQLESLKELIQKSSIQTMGWGSFDKGILAGSVHADRKFEKDDARSWAPWWKKSKWKTKVAQVEQLEQKYGLKIKNYALAYALDHADFSLVGMKTKQHIDDILAMTQKHLNEGLDYSQILDDIRDKN